ncbi:MAG: oligosaccharide flippase family protein [Bacteroidetes bacterium]|nr:oligosaccharide flippase family protein [Bacteroidota bacterium]
MSELNQLRLFLLNFFNKGHERTIEAKRNIAFSFLIKGTSIIISLLLVPLTISYVNPTQYGIWLTLSSIVSWFGFFDIGFGNGLRNRYAEAKAKNDTEKLRIYVSTTYAIQTIIFLAILIVLLILNNFLDWTKILNADITLKSELSKLASIVFIFFCLQFILKTITVILYAEQKSSIADLLNMMGQLLSLILIFVLTHTTKGSLTLLGSALSFSPIVVLIVASIYLFQSKYKFITPSFKSINFKYVKDLLNIGIKFFIIQISVVVIYQSNNIIISHIGTPEDVTIYNIAYKYMAVVLMGFSIIINPFWSAFTEAYTKNDYKWMRKAVSRLRKLSYSITIVVFVMIISSNFIYHIWIGNKVLIPNSVTIICGIYIVFSSWMSLNTQILNGIGRIKLQLLTFSLGTVFHIPVAFLLGQKYGIIGVVISSTLFTAIISVFSILQIDLILKKKAKGIWLQ